MGCGASKSIESQVVETTLPQPPSQQVQSTNIATTTITPSPTSTSPNTITTNTTNCPTDLPIIDGTRHEIDSSTPTHAGTSPITTDIGVPCNSNEISSSVTVVGVRLISDGAVPTGAVAVSAEPMNGKAYLGRGGSGELMGKDDNGVVKAPTLSRTVVPSIPSELISKAVAFEIPLDEDLKSRPQDDDNGGSSNIRVSLPKLALSQQDIAEKLANTEARWKHLEQARESRKQRKRGDKPELTPHKPTLRATTADPVALKRRLLEKEAQATQNRLREIEKLQLKLARQEEHARRVKDRKRAMGRLSNENLNLSWGGEDADVEEGDIIECDVVVKDLDLELDEVVNSGVAATAHDGGKIQISHSSKMMMKKLVFGEHLTSSSISPNLVTAKSKLLAASFDADSGKGSSAASLSNGSRSGSGRSTGTVDIGDVAETKATFDVVV
ncbi:hypothetical protein HDU76_009122 [Blyttiomyces sp. JEL0837]|nr:hypothetical protein HDU76_009122 [Blyttiomyces sp. JEL0837]